VSTDDGAFGSIPIGVEFVQRMAAEAEGQQDVRRMRHEQHVSDVNRMLDTTPVDHLVLWGHLLNKMNRNTANYLEGMIVSLLRVVHKVCPACGEPSHMEAGTTCPE
jgi:hypothetical protein